MLDTARRISRSRALLWTLTVRELKARYRGSALGFLWSLANPLLLLAVYTFVFGFAFRPVRGEGIDPYALFLVCGLFPWVWASTSLNEAVVSLSVHSGLLRKAAFPAELLPMVAVAGNLIHFLLALPVLGCALLAGSLMGYPVGGWSALALPLVIALELPLLAGLSLALAALYVHFRDLKDILANALSLLFFLTPILYPLEAIPFRPLVALVRANPFTPFTIAYQQLLFAGEVPGPGLWLHMAAVAAGAWWVGAFLFGRLRETLVEAV